MAEQDLPPTDQPQSQPEEQPKEPPPPKRRRRGWWWKVPLILLVCVILLVLFAPMIASTGPVRSFAIGIVNDNLNGRLELEDWSLGWFRGIDVRGLKVYDVQDRQILELGALETDLTLVDVLQSDFSLGDARVDLLRFQLEVDEQGRTNFEKLAKADPAAPPDPPAQEQPMRLPDVSGTITVSDFGGTIVAAGQPPVHVDPSSAVVKIPDINAPIQNEIKLNVRVADGGPGTIAAAGTIDIAEENQLLDELSGDQKVVLSSIDAAAVSPFLKLAGVDLILNGTAGGELAVQTQAGQNTIVGEVLVNSFAATGELLNGDTLRTDVLRIPINITQSTAADMNVLTVDTLGLDLGDLGSISLKAKAPVQSLAAAAAAVPQAIQSAVLGGAEAQPVDLVGQGQAELVVQLNAAAIAQQLPRTLGLDKDLNLQSGRLASTTTLTIDNAQARLASTTTLENFAGVSAGQPVRLEPITLAANAVATGGADPDLRDVQLAFDSGFGRLTATGPALTNISVDGRFDLDRLEDQASQFLALGDLEMSGTATLTAATEGDLAQSRGDMGTRLSFVAENLRVAGLEGLGVIDQPRVELTYAGVIERGGDAFAAAVRDVAVTFVAGEPQSPTIRFAAGGRATLAPQVAAEFAVTELVVPRLPEFYAELQQVLPALRESDLQVLSGQLRTTLAGTYGDEAIVLTEPLALVIEGLTLSTKQAAPQAEPILRDEDINLAAAGTIRLGDAMGVQLNALSISTESDLVRVQKAPDVDLSVVLREPADGEPRDLAPLEMVRSAKINIEVPRAEKLWALVQALTPTEPVVAEEEAGEPLPPLQVAGGAVAMNLAIARPAGAAQTTINVDELRVSSLALARGTRQWQGDMRLQLQAAVEGRETLQSLAVNELAGQLGVTDLTMTEPIRISDPTGNLVAQGGIRLAGQIGRLTELLETLQGAEPGEGYPYDGAYVVTQRLETRGDTIALVGDLAVNQFRVMQEGQVAFAEERIDLTNNILIDPRPEKQVLAIEDLSLAMRSSEAVQVAVKGLVSDWDESRKIRDLTVRLNYDLAKLWPIIRPMVTDESGGLAQLSAAGKVERAFRISGAYPANLEFRRAVKRLVVDGSIAVPLVEGDGLRLENLEIPISLREGRLATIPFGEAAVPPAPATLNGGVLNLNNFIVDLTGDAPRLTIEDNHVLMQDVAMSPMMMQAGGQYLNFLFADATEAQGVLTVGISYCRELALGERITSAKSGTAKVVFSVQQLQLANPKGGWLAGQLAAAIERSLGGKLPVGQLLDLDVNKGVADVYKGRIREAVVMIEAGRIYEDITLEVIDPNKALDVIAAEQRIEEETFPLRIQGEVGLKNLQQDLTFHVPPQLLDKWFRNKRIVELLPEGLPVALGGTPTQPTVDFGNVASRVAQGLIQQQLPGVLGGGEGRDAPASPEEAIGGLLERLGGRREREQQPAPDGVIGRPAEQRPRVEEPAPSEIIGREAQPDEQEERRRRRERRRQREAEQAEPAD